MFGRSLDCNLVDRVICATGFPYVGKFRLRRSPESAGDPLVEHDIFQFPLSYSKSRVGELRERVSFCKFTIRQYLRGFLRENSLGNRANGNTRRFRMAPSRLPGHKVNHYERLWKIRPYFGGQSPSQSGIVGAMKFGKIPPQHHFRAEAMPI